MVETIHLIHHSHFDYGYTDLPSTTLAMQVDFLAQAARLWRATAHHHPDARFRWSCESLLVVERFLAEAAADDREAFLAAVDAGDIEVGVMPHGTTSLLDGDTWDAYAEAVRPVLARVRPTTVFQNDINGLPWGLIPRWRALGCDTVWMGVNNDAGGPPEPAPAAWWWEGPDGGRLFCWQGLPYPEAWGWFNDWTGWRFCTQHAHGIWNHPPGPEEAWVATPEGLARSRECLLARLERRAWPHAVLPVQTTGRWRSDNDPPLPQLATFVQAWNAAGLTPRLVLSTPRRAAASMRAALGDTIPVRRGDWPDWWSDCPATHGAETALVVRAQRRLADLPRLQRLVGAPAEPVRAARAWRDACWFAEHTFGGFKAATQPYEPRSLGVLAEKTAHAHRAHEESLRLQADALRASAAYVPFSRAGGVRVVNPGDAPRSGWIELAALAPHRPATALRDRATGALAPLETVDGPEWSFPTPGRAYERPDGCFGWMTLGLRTHVADLAPGAARDFDLVDAAMPAPAVADATGADGALAWRFDAARGTFASLAVDGVELIDARALDPFGAVVVDEVRGLGDRWWLGRRDQERLARLRRFSVPRIVSAGARPSHRTARFAVAAEHPALHRVEQVWDLHPCGLVELTTTVWVRETVDPLALHLALPVAGTGPLAYDSGGHRTVWGRDQLPGTCGEYILCGGRVELERGDRRWVVACADTPLVQPDAIRLRRGVRRRDETVGGIYPILVHDFWHVNCPPVREGKLVVRHAFRLAGRGQEVDPLGDLAAFPIA